MKLLVAITVCTFLSVPTVGSTQESSAGSADGAETAANATTGETADPAEEIICRNRPRPVSRLPNRNGRICMTAKEWDRVTQENRDEARRMLAPGAIDQTNPDGP